MNMAFRWIQSVLYLCKNKGYAITVPLPARNAQRQIVRRAMATEWPVLRSAGKS